MKRRLFATSYLKLVLILGGIISLDVVKKIDRFRFVETCRFLLYCVDKKDAAFRIRRGADDVT